MIVALVAAAWTVALVLVAGLCAAARRGDRADSQDRARERELAKRGMAPARPHVAAAGQLSRAA
jgi:hypothetical protein